MLETHPAQFTASRNRQVTAERKVACRLGLTAFVLQPAEELVEFVGGVEIGFEFARPEAFPKIVEAASQKIERGGKNFAIGEHNVAPRGIGAPGQTQRIAQAGPGNGDRQTVFVEAIVEKRC